MSFPPATNAAYAEPLPLYSRDPETLSIRSNAPSYTSEAPSYHSTRPLNARTISFAGNNGQQSLPCSSDSGLPSRRFAPGFNRGISTGSLSNVENHKFNVGAWSSHINGLQARHYHNVAHRRATVSNTEERSVIGAMQRLQELDSPRHGEEPAVERDNEEDATGAYPLEDPDLVGPEAAARARVQRLYMQTCKEEEALRLESKTWDFMLSQMGDWKEREKSWEKFRKEVGRSRLLGRRTGLRGSVS